MAPGAADQYEAYLNSLHGEMDERLEELGHLSAQLDGHDDNQFTRGMVEFIQSISDTAEELMDGIYELTRNTLLAELKTKNEVTKSVKQDEYISQIEAAAEKLQDRAGVTEAGLDGDASFTEDEMDQMVDGFASLLDNWKDSIEKLIQQAVDIQEDSRQDELSGAYAAMEEHLNGFQIALEDAAEQISTRQFDISDRHAERKKLLTQKAGEHMSGVVSKLKSELEEKASAFDDLDF